MASRSLLDVVRKRIGRFILSDPAYAFLYAPAPPGEAVSLDCETTGLDPLADDIVSICAILIRGDRILTSQRLEMIVRPPQPVMRTGAVPIHRLRPGDVAGGVPIDEAVRRLLHYVGSRPLVGYYLAFDMMMLDKYVHPMLNILLPHRQIEVSALYYDSVAPRAPGPAVDLSFGAIMKALDLPLLAAHDAFNDALMAAMMYLRLKPREPT